MCPMPFPVTALPRLVPQSLFEEVGSQAHCARARKSPKKTWSIGVPQCQWGTLTPLVMHAPGHPQQGRAQEACIATIPGILQHLPSSETFCSPRQAHNFLRPSTLHPSLDASPRCACASPARSAGSLPTWDVESTWSRRARCAASLCLGVAPFIDRWSGFAPRPCSRQHREIVWNASARSIPWTSARTRQEAAWCHA